MIEPTFRFSIVIPVRFGDMDALGHVNNAKYLTYFEEARLAYWMNLFPLDKSRFASLGFILAQATISFKNPAAAKDTLKVFIRVSTIGNKSFTMEYTIENVETLALVAEGSTVQVMYDYEKGVTIPVPEDFKKKVLEFEHIS